MALTPALAQSPGHAQRHRQVTVPESSGLAPVALRAWLLYPGAKHLQSHPTVSGWAEGWLEFSSQLVVPVGCDPHLSARAAVVQCPGQCREGLNVGLCHSHCSSLCCWVPWGSSRF